jgi:hypothetical protein
VDDVRARHQDSVHREAVGTAHRRGLERAASRPAAARKTRGLPAERPEAPGFDVDPHRGVEELHDPPPLQRAARDRELRCEDDQRRIQVRCLAEPDAAGIAQTRDGRQTRDEPVGRKPER